MPEVPSVLVAEDYPDFRAKLLDLLEPLGLTCIPTTNGRQAIEALQDPSQRVDLVITDMDMPVHTGWDVIDAAYKHRGKDIPIIMQTGEAYYTYVQRRAEKLGIVLIHKIDINVHLVPAVREALKLSLDGEKTKS